MKKLYQVRLQSEISDSYNCQRAANSLDIDVKKKSIHELKISADLDTAFTVGLILGASGSGKTTLAKEIWGQDVFKDHLDMSKPVIDQFPESMGYSERAELLSGVGLTSVPCWIRPAYTLSNGQRARAEAALAMVNAGSGLVVIDEWTSVVDRTVAKVMSHCVQKFARKHSKRVVLLSCHYDVTEWLMPDWVIDCNKESYEEHRGSLRQRTERLDFDVRSVGRECWPYFSKYHYLSDKLPGGKQHFFGLFQGENQVGFLVFSNYMPKREGHRFAFHFNRLVIHPDYAGFGLGVKFLNAACEALLSSHDYDIYGAFSSVPVFRALKKDPLWRLMSDKVKIGKTADQKKPARSNFGRTANTKTFRTNLRMYSFKWVGRTSQRLSL